LKISSKNNNKILYICTSFSKFKNSDLENFKHRKNFYPIRIQYEKFNKNDKSKFENDLVYFFSFDHG
jgi:hypothetical protein